MYSSFNIQKHFKFTLKNRTTRKTNVWVVRNKLVGDRGNEGVLSTFCYKKIIGLGNKE